MKACTSVWQHLQTETPSLDEVAVVGSSHCDRQQQHVHPVLGVGGGDRVGGVAPSRCEGPELSPPDNL